jgi:photosystem II stability/assembly factor-like uncharacterized protein
MKNLLFYSALALALLGCANKSYVFEFVEVNTPGSSSLRAISAVDANTVWVSGSQGQVYLSKNGGTDWKAVPVPGCEETEFRSLHAWNEKRALVFDVSPEGRAFLTEDAGQSWEQVYASPKEGAFYNSLKFANDKQGLAISDPVDNQVFVLRTTDGGRTWKRLENTPKAQEGEINFAASNTCIEYLPTGEIYIVTGGSKARMLTSKNHGESWNFVETPVISGPSAGLFSVNFTQRKRGIAVGGDYNEPEREGVRAIYTEDGGKTWLQAENMPAAYRSCVISPGDQLSFALGKTGCDYSVNGGKNWIFIDSLNYYAGDAVEDGNLLYVAGPEGRVAKVTITRE